MKKLLIIAVLVIAVAAVGLIAKGKGGGSTIGAEIPEGMHPVTVAQALDLGHNDSGAEVVIKGKMTEKCPTSGCWFYLSDDTGRIRVDTQFSGFTVVDYKTGADVTLYGKVMKPENGDPEISAIGAKF